MGKYPYGRQAKGVSGSNRRPRPAIRVRMQDGVAEIGFYQIAEKQAFNHSDAMAGIENIPIKANFQQLALVLFESVSGFL